MLVLGPERVRSASRGQAWARLLTGLLESVRNVSVDVSAQLFWRGGRTSRAVVPCVEPRKVRSVAVR